MTVEPTISAPAPTESPHAAPAPAGREREGRWRPSPELGRNEWWVVGLIGLGLAILTSWPLAAHLRTHIAPDLGDPVRTAWQVAWVGHAALRDPLHLWTANAFWPHRNSLAFSDSLLGYAPVAMIGSGVTAAVTRYNVLFLFAFTLAFVGPYFLLRELGSGRGGALVAGAAFAYAPFRGDELGHLHVISSGAIPLALALMLRGYRRGSHWTALAGWLVAAWQLSLGFTLGLQLGYLLGALAIAAAVFWWRRGRPPLPRRMVAVTLAGMLVFAAVGTFEGRPYLQISHDYPTAKRTTSQVKRYSADLLAFVAAPQPNRIWGLATSSARAHVSSKNESALFPGLIIVVLAAIGVATPLLTRRLRWWILGGVVICALLSLGLDLLPGGWPYRLLMDYAPGWNGVRVPGRITTLTSLGLAVLAGAGAHHVIRSAARRQRWISPLRAGGAIATVLALGIVVEGAGRMAHPRVPVPPRGLAGIRGPLLMLPTDSASDRIYQLWSVNGFPQIVNGNSTFDIPQLDDLRGGMAQFPDAPGVQKLRGEHIYTAVMLHHRIAGLPKNAFSSPLPADPGANSRKPITGIAGVTRSTRGGVTVFRITP